MERLLLVDNRDSFTWNLVQAFEGLGVAVDVRGSDALTVDEVVSGARWPAVVLGPGPGRPEDAGVTLDLVRAAAGRLSILGVCLGHQAIAAAFGGRVVRARRAVHGRLTEVVHDRTGVFRELPSPFRATRYNSLVVDPGSLPEGFEVHARDPDGEVLGLRHRRWPLEGVQFHPESILSEHAETLLGGWLRGAGVLAAVPES